MVKTPIRNLRSSKPVPPRLCDILIEGEEIALQFKIGKNEYETVPWQDVVLQVKQAEKPD